MLKPLSRVLLVALVFGASMLGSAPSSAAAALAARSSDEAGVQVVVTPKALGQDVAVWEFNVVMDTHTKPLTDDLAKVAVLVDGAGRRYVPVAWQGDPPGGHHRKGVLQFSAPAERPKSVELQINGVGGVATRTFRWEIE
jgi:hypothetical protein